MRFAKTQLNKLERMMVLALIGSFGLTGCEPENAFGPVLEIDGSIHRSDDKRVAYMCESTSGLFATVFHDPSCTRTRTGYEPDHAHDLRVLVLDFSDDRTYAGRYRISFRNGALKYPDAVTLTTMEEQCGVDP